MDGDLVAVVVLGYLDVPGYGSYLPGDVAGFERNVAETLIRQRRARRFQELASTTPPPSAKSEPEQAPKQSAAEPETVAPLVEFVRAVTAPSSRLAVAVAFLREILDRRPRPVTEVLTLARQRGISRATLRRAKRALWVRSQKIGMKAGWAWMIRDGASKGERLRAYRGFAVEPLRQRRELARTSGNPCGSSQPRGNQGFARRRSWYAGRETTRRLL